VRSSTTSSPFKQAPILAALFAVLTSPFFIAGTAAAAQYTPRQLEAHGQYVGRTYWIVERESKPPAFLTAPSPTAPSFQPAVKESFEIKEIVRGAPKTTGHYYRVVFDSGKEGFLPIDTFLDNFQAAFVTADPDRNAKARLAKEAEIEEKRVKWIQARRWPEHVKEAALKKQPALGMNKDEAKAVLGKPKRVVEIKTFNVMLGAQEQWTYENGSVLTFTNGIITRIQSIEPKTE
jgi:hypothetical protein